MAERTKTDTAVPVKPESKSSDVVLIHGVSEDGESLAVLRARADRVEAGVLRAVKGGELAQGSKSTVVELMGGLA